MEGKEVRFGIANTALFATVTTAASLRSMVGSTRSHHSAASCRSPTSSWSEVVFGGVGDDGVLVYIILSVFIASWWDALLNTSARRFRPSRCRWRC